VKTTRMLAKTDLDALVLDLLNAGVKVIAPVRCKDQGGCTEYGTVNSPDEIVLDGPQPLRPLKDVVFPPTETLFRWRQVKSSIQIEEAPSRFPETVILGARPCDAAAFEIVDRVMGWDYRDELWFGRRQATTVLAIACSQYDDSCFCTGVGLSPASTRGADLFLKPLENGGFEVDALTQKGEAFLDRHPSRCPEMTGTAKPKANGTEDKVRANLAANPEKVRQWLDTHFDDPIWKHISLRCHGCGACAFVCPTCHCFDIVDEPEGIDCGQRCRNWDACQPALFTLHGSGHNPRKDQAARFRQRIMHKFNIYPSRFGEILCTGCGRCVRVCGAGMDLIAILNEIGVAAEEAGNQL
jgi:ferredoxin